MNYLVISLYIISFALFIYGLMGLTGPKTAVRGNLIAAVGMALAVTATLIKIRHTESWVLIIAGLVVGVVLGVPPARMTKMTAMPQLVAFFNGVGGGTVALIALAEFIDTKGFSAFQHHESPTVHIVVASLFAAIIGSISFWGSIIAFGKLQEIISGAPIGLGRAQQLVNLLLLIGSIVAAVEIGLHAHPGSGGASLWWMIGLLAAAAVLGLMVVLPIGGADMPVVISLLNYDAAGRVPAGVGLLVGAVGYYGLTTWLNRRAEREDPEEPVEDAEDVGGDTASPSGADATAARNLTVGMVLDGIPESIAIGLTLLGGGTVSVALVGAVFLSNLPDAIGVAAALLGVGSNCARCCCGSRRSSSSASWPGSRVTQF